MNNYKQVTEEEFNNFVGEQALVESYKIPSIRVDRPDEKVFLQQDGNYPQDVKAYQELGEPIKYYVVE